MSERFSTRDLALAAMFAALTAVGALFAIPFFGPIPFTLQVFFVLLAGLVLGPRLAAMSMVAYVCVGLFAPVFAGGASGLGTLFGPAGGYIWGFVLGATLVGYLSQRLSRPRFAEPRPGRRSRSGSHLRARRDVAGDQSADAQSPVRPLGRRSAVPAHGPGQGGAGRRGCRGAGGDSRQAPHHDPARRSHRPTLGRVTVREPSVTTEEE